MSKSYSTLVNGVNLDGGVIDVFMSLMKENEDMNWEEVSFIPTKITNAIFNSIEESIDIPKLFTDNPGFENCLISQKVHLPYCFKNLWYLVVLDVNNRSFKLYHSYGYDLSEAERAKKNFDHFLSCVRTSGRQINFMINIDWNLEKPEERYPLQQDSNFHLSGYYVLLYMGMIAANVDFSQLSQDFKFDLEQFQENLASSLVKLTVSWNDVCGFCPEPLTIESADFVPCTGCIKWAHKRCTTDNYCDSVCKVCQVFIENTTYAIGFLNPDENLCWLNSSLHVLLSLPVFQNLENLLVAGIIGDTQILNLFITLQFSLKEGLTKQQIYQDVV